MFQSPVKHYVMDYATVILIKFLTIVVEVIIRICLDIPQFDGVFINLESSIL
jgi:hypothetical protein